MQSTTSYLLILQNISIQNKNSEIKAYPLCLGNISMILHSVTLKRHS